VSASVEFDNDDRPPAKLKVLAQGAFGEDIFGRAQAAVVGAEDKVNRIDVDCRPARARSSSFAGRFGVRAHPAVQRFGSFANLNVQLHVCFSDGVFAPGGEDRVRFRALAAPTDGEVEAVLRKVVRRVAQISRPSPGRLRE
jgi:hypothetical protein